MPNLDWIPIVPYIFGFMALAIVGWVAKSIDRMSRSVEELNIRIAVIINQIESHDKRITRLEDEGNNVCPKSHEWFAIGCLIVGMSAWLFWAHALG